MEQNSWEIHQLHVMSELQDLKEDSKAHREALAELRADLKSFKTSQKWELRILSAIWGLIVLAVNAILGRHA